MIQDLKLITPSICQDKRGYFWNHLINKLLKHIKNNNFVQDNESRSNRGTLRGLHFQEPPYAQGKLVRVIIGEVFDVVVDLRSDSSTYGEHVALKLNGKQKQMLYVHVDLPTDSLC